MVVGEVRPRTLVIFASGGIEPGQIERLREEIDLARNDRAPIQVLVFGFGSAQSFDTFPAETESLAKLAVELDGTFIDLGNELPSVQTRQRIDSQFNAILRRGEQWVISANTGAVPVGAVSLQVEAGGSTSEFMFQNPAVPPSVTLKASSTSWQGDVSLTIASPIAQAPITQVQYLLDNYLIGESSLATGAYSYSFSSTDRTFLSHFPPGEHMLVAAVTDERGLQSRSDPLTITLLAPAKPDGMVGVLMEYWWVILLLVIATLAVVSMKTVFKVKKPSSKVGTNPVNPPSQEDPTKRYGEPSIDPPPPIDAGRTQKFDDGKATKRLDDDEEKTGRFDPLYGAKSVSRWFLYIVEGAESATFDLQAQRHYDIGRPARGHQPHIPINNTLVSRNHAKLERLVNGLELRALETENGTFLGEERRQLKTNECVSLKSGDVFWLSPQVKLRVESQG
jgi:hypothetical protein